MADDADFVVSLIINIVLAIVFLSLFIFFRGRYPKVYMPRCDGSAHAPPVPPNTLFGWFFTTVRYSDEKLLRTHGLDAVMFLKFVKMMICIACCVSIYGFVVLFAVNATGENTDTADKDYRVYGLDSLTLSGVETKSSRLVAHLFAVIINSIIVYYFTFTMYRTYMHLRLRYKASRDKIENYSVMIRGVPLTIDDESLSSFFEELFPNKVVSVVRSFSTPKIADLMEERDDMKRNLEKAHAEHQITGKRPKNKDKLLIGNVVDSLEWYSKEFTRLSNEVGELQKKQQSRACVVFVVFNDLATAAQCSQILLDTKTTFLPEPAPEPRDLIWKNFYIDHHQFLVRKVVINILFALLVFFWSIPVVFISGLSNLENLSKTGAFSFLVDIIESSPIVSGFLQGFLPTLAYIVFFAILIKLITFMVVMSGVYTNSKVSRVVTTKYFAFKVVNTLLIYSISGSIIGVVSDFADGGLSFSSIINLLANSLPKQSGFFINLIMLYSLSGHTKALWNPGALIVTWLKQRFLTKTAREYREAEAPPPFKYSEAYTMHLLVFTILLTYSTLAPFIMIFGVIYFCMAYVSDKYNIMYVNVPQWEGGGKHWHDVFYRMCAGTMLYQILLIGVFSIYKFVPGVVTSAICACCTVVAMWYIRNQFVRSCNYLPQRYAARRDALLVEDISKSDLLKVDSHDPRIKIDEGLELSGEIGPTLPIYENNKRDVTNVNAHQFYFQPTLVPLADEPEFILAPGRAPTKLRDEWTTTKEGEFYEVPLSDLEDGKFTEERKGRVKDNQIVEEKGKEKEENKMSPLAERGAMSYMRDDDDSGEGER